MNQKGVAGINADGRRGSIPSLDGLRAISVGLVILSHCRGTRGFPGWIPPVIADHGALGVQVFFVISGFLITTLLLDEQRKTGRISLRLFYARRTLRIFPPFYAFLGILAVATWAGAFSIPWSNFAFAATYTMNYATNGLWATGHIWSLSVEEQFYLAWPLAIKLMGTERAWRSAAIVALGAPAICLGFYLLDSGLGVRLSKYFPFVADSIAAGCVIPAFLKWARGRERVLPWFSFPAGDLVIPVIFLLELGRNHPRIHLALTETALNLSICYAIVRYTEFPSSVVGRFLNLPACSFVGKLSYSLYLWQQIFANRYGAYAVQAFPLNALAGLACALASYHVVEKPLMGLRGRLRPALPSPAEKEVCAVA